jgi:hypothetical protein
MTDLSVYALNVAPWPEAIIVANVTGEIEEMNRRAHALKVQEAYRTSKGFTMRMIIAKKLLPQCQMDMPIGTEHFRRTWSRPEDDSIFVSGRFSIRMGHVSLHPDRGGQSSSSMEQS